MNSIEKLEIAVKAADSKRGEKTVAIDVHEISLLADYFMITQADSARQVKAIVKEIQDQEELAGVEVRRIEGRNSTSWVLLDFGDLIVHVFKTESREFYDLEKFWSEGASVDLSAWIEE